jgi:hypothetical protein
MSRRSADQGMAQDSEREMNVVSEVFLRQLVLNLVKSMQLDQAIQNSCHDFHATGIDYLCLHRTKELTVKAYFLGEGVALGKNVVNPHDHAYNFSTFVLSGTLANVNFYPTSSIAEPVWFRHVYETPLRAAPRFSFDKPVRLREEERYYEGGDHYYLDHAQVHTIRAYSSDVVMLLFQYKSERTADHGTGLFLPDRNVPSLDNLYRPFNEDELTSALRRLTSLVENRK